MADLKRLRAFVIVAEELHFGRAAKRLHVSQPPLTRLITSLEKELRFRLFDRSTRAVDLTIEGREFLPYAKQLINADVETWAFAERIAAGKAGRIRISYASSIALSDFFTRSLKQFTQHRSDVQLVLEEASSKDQWNQIASGLTDLALVRCVPEAMDGLKVCQLGAEPLVLAVGDNDPRVICEVHDLARERLIMFPDNFGSGLNDATFELLLRRGVKYQRGPSAHAISAIVALVAAGQGVAILPSCAQCISRPGVRFMPIAGDDATISMYAMTHPDRQTVLGQAFLDTLDHQRSHPRCLFE